MTCSYLGRGGPHSELDTCCVDGRDNNRTTFVLEGGGEGGRAHQVFVCVRVLVMLIEVLVVALVLVDGVM